ncbi:hypothetical protein K9L97_04750 [Candidatus Woesearchaeota archaeon]|nr:hypothetical protein [Candidatus Woesearchaeota archaeon]
MDFIKKYSFVGSFFNSDLSFCGELDLLSSGSVYCDVSSNSFLDSALKGNFKRFNESKYLLLDDDLLDSGIPNMVFAVDVGNKSLSGVKDGFIFSFQLVKNFKGFMRFYDFDKNYSQNYFFQDISFRLPVMIPFSAEIYRG